MESATSRRPHLAISLGDPCGIGPELLLRSLPALLETADITVVGTKAGPDLLEGLPEAPLTWHWAESRRTSPAGFLGRALNLVLCPADRTDQSLAKVSWLDPTPDLQAGRLKLGEGSAASGEATVQAIRTAALMTMAGQADALVTLPMAKSAAHLAGHDIPGHTEFLGGLAGAPLIRMAFVSPSLQVVLHTVHQSLRSVIETLDATAVAETLIFSAREFIRLTAKPDLRVALCALNPHAGEQGAFGDEEVKLVEALRRAEAAFAKPTPGVAPRFFGPLPSDSLFHRAVSGEFDLVVALYHDQGLIPIKLLEPTTAVNLTLGLPFIRTSPDHGTAFDKAGRWIADPRNFQSAAALAVDLVGRRWRATSASPGPGL
jgi:4-hydroxythreonine-4-phosphate dehydrogenase